MDAHTLLVHKPIFTSLHFIYFVFFCSSSTSSIAHYGFCSSNIYCIIVVLFPVPENECLSRSFGIRTGALPCFGEISHVNFEFICTHAHTLTNILLPLPLFVRWCTAFTIQLCKNLRYLFVEMFRFEFFCVVMGYNSNSNSNNKSGNGYDPNSIQHNPFFEPSKICIRKKANWMKNIDNNAKKEGAASKKAEHPVYIGRSTQKHIRIRTKKTFRYIRNSLGTAILHAINLC